MNCPIFGGAKGVSEPQAPHNTCHLALGVYSDNVKNKVADKEERYESQASSVADAFSTF